ncbi:MAG TPA: ABC transporter ATP-binding protein [Stellaceae bacterium]|nr:ABC transporter ATP-binding protein [Stellaceae bacterium]
MTAVDRRTVGAPWRQWLAVTVGFVLAYYLAQLVVLELRFGHWPNYITFYDYPANVARIVRHTPSVLDMVPIVLDEWLVEVGYMNYDFGHGIAEWSLAILPPKLFAVTLLGAVLGFDLLLWRRARPVCSAAQRPIAASAAGVGAVLFGLANISLTWVVCCATPSWVVGLTLLGFDSAVSLSLEPYGIWLALVGALLLAGATLWLGWRSRAGAAAAQAIAIRGTNDVSTALAETRERPRNGEIRIERVSVRFGQGAEARTAILDVSIDIEPGAFVCLLGPSGCGKSTLLNCVAGYVTPSAGAVRVDEAKIDRPGPDRGMVFQQYSLFPWKSVRDNVAFGPRLAGKGRVEAHAVADRFLEMVGLGNFAARYPAELSGGMQQRVGIARALANYPSVLLMDEPFGALDAQTRAMMQENLLRIWSEFGTTVLFVTHDVDEAVFLADRVLVMSAGPGRVIADIAVPIARPRAPDISTRDDFIRVKRQCLDLIRAESLKAFAQQNT